MLIAKGAKPLSLALNDWQQATPLAIASFRPESSSHRPAVQLQLRHGDDSLQGLFTVNDQYVRCVKQNFQDMVCEDSCVEIFLQPHNNPSGPYMSLEISGNGTILSYLINDPTRTDTGFVSYRPLTECEGAQISITTSLPKLVAPELDQPTTWLAAFSLPKSLLASLFGEHYSEQGPWRMNAFKCADKSSHPHWGSWQPVPEFNFHDPSAFGQITLSA